MHQVWHAIFSNDHPVEVEIGPGTGTVILAAAHCAPCTNFFGLERSAARAARLQSKIDARGLRNALVIAADASCAVSTLIPTESVAAYHIYFPDPWWKRRHHRRRLFTPAFATALAHTLVPGGRIHVATDVDDVFTLMRDTLQPFAALSDGHCARAARAAVTSFERKGLARGATIKEATFVKRERPGSYASSAAPMTPAESPNTLWRMGVRSSSLNT
jgi:tRNA (guanine-N7-)-methyltransferase